MHNGDIAAFATDARNFVTAFAGIISKSTPHLYLSALPFAPTQSRVSKQFLPQFPRTLFIRNGKAADWSPILAEFNSTAATVVAISRNGEVALESSGHSETVGFSHSMKASDPRTLFIRNGKAADWSAILAEPNSTAATVVAISRKGEVALELSGHSETVSISHSMGTYIASDSPKGHTDWITSIALSPDGKHIVSGSYDMTAYVWDTETGELVSELPLGLTDWVMSVAFSQDGKRVVCGSGDNIFIFATLTWTTISGPLQGHTQLVAAVAFSRDGRFVVSGSYDKTVVIWDVESGEILAGPVRGHSGLVTSVAFSPDGTRIVSGSYDETIRIWYTKKQKIVSQALLRGHTDRVTSVAFSQDGKRVVSGSHDNTIRIWDGITGENITAPLRGHTDSVMSVSYSICDKLVVSSSFDQTVRIWNVENREIISTPFRGHIQPVSSVAFSQDGKYVVSGSYDKSIRIWNIQMRESIHPTFDGAISSFVAEKYTLTASFQMYPLVLSKIIQKCSMAGSLAPSRSFYFGSHISIGQLCADLVIRIS
jgi:WD40 repeat protein